MTSVKSKSIGITRKSEDNSTWDNWIFYVLIIDGLFDTIRCEYFIRSQYIADMGMYAKHIYTSEYRYGRPETAHQAKYMCFTEVPMPMDVLQEVNEHIVALLNEPS